MGRVSLTAIVGEKDKGVILDKSRYEKSFTISFEKNFTKEDVSIRAIIKRLKQLKLEPTEAAMDLLIVACSMYAADVRFLRDRHGEDGWTRLIDLYIPVSNLASWQSQTNLLQNIFRFLTGDIWTIYFRERDDKELVLSPRGKLKRYGMPYTTDTVCLFSGGMDSFIGAMDLLQKGVQPLLVSHSKSADVSYYQGKCEEAVKNTFPNLIPERIDAHIGIPKVKIKVRGKSKKEEVENTERGRSFLFLSLGAVCASAVGDQSKLIVPENGLITLNIPLTPLRVGSLSTRTTHPHYFSMMMQLFHGLGLRVTILNPYQFKTKGEMLTECSNSDMIAKTESMSCSHPSARWHGMGNIHCGYCVPCLNRQAAFLKAGIKDKNMYRENIFKKKGLRIDQSEGADILAFKYMIEKVKKKPDYLLAAIRNTGPLGENVEDFVSVYRRGLAEIEELIKNVKLK